MKTDIANLIDKSCPWNVYPRPQLVRNSFICLNGFWDFCISKKKEIPTVYNEKILVPFPPESELSQINRNIGKSDVLYYRRFFTVPEDFIQKKLLLHFGAVDRETRVFVNGKSVLTSDCGYIPFSADITDYITDGENELILEVTDGSSTLYPYGKQRKKRGGMWYTNVSGIWQTVWLESVPEGHIESIKITPTKSDVTIFVKTNSKYKKITLLDSNEELEFSSESIKITPKNPINWTPENPYLYRFKVQTETDSVESYFALREISILKIGGVPRICLNGKPYLFNGLLDQGYFPDGLFLPATPEGYENDIFLAKSLGFNTLRKHIKIEPQIFYYLCDKLGIAVFQDMVNNGTYSFIRDTALPTVFMKRLPDKRLHKNKESRRAFIDCMKKTAELLYNSPSVVYYTVFNEGWGQFCADEAYDLLKSIDGTRIIDATSGWFWQHKSDVDSYHVYFKKPRISAASERPFVLSEFGGYSHRVSGHLFGEKNYGYRTFKNREEFENAVLDLYEDGVLKLVENGISALIYTQISDIEDETNGFITYDRKVVKVDAEKFKKSTNFLYKTSCER
ncbi:MAG: glycoside hydrolase family 2 [Clostridia bacterium]|nr:glycoside hydrolase family 2 [Clostridia bacterium]